MTNVSLKLESLKLSCSKERIRLLVISSATFHTEDDSFQHMASGELVNLMRNGKVCITRGPGCGLDFKIDPKNLQLNEVSREALVDELGRFVLDAPWWGQIPVSPSLKLPVSSGSDVKLDFSIEIHDTLPTLLSNEYPQTEISPATHVQVPECVPVMKLISINFLFTFEPIKDRPLPRLMKEAATTNDMLLEDVCETDVDNFEDIMDLNASEFFISHHKSLSDTCPLLDDESHIAGYILEDNPIDDTYDDLLLYENEDNKTGLLTPKASTASNSQEDTNQPSPMEIYSTNGLGSEPSLKLSTAKELVDVAIRSCIGGRQIKSLPGIRIRKPRPNHPLSDIMPLLWSPGFQNTMSQRCEFLNTVANTLGSISKTAQLPSLCKKLALIQENNTAKNAKAHAPHLNQTIQAHLFRMMHTSLHEPISARRLRPSIVERCFEKETITVPLTQVQSDIVLPKIDTNFVEEVEDADFEDMLGEELLSDDEIDMLFDLEIQRNQHKGKEGESSRMLLESTGGSGSMLLGSENNYEDVTVRDEDSSMFPSWESHEEGGDEDILEESDSWSLNFLDGLMDSEMIMDNRLHTDHRYSSVYQDGSYVDKEAILI